MKALILVLALFATGCSVTVTGVGAAAAPGLPDNAGWTRSAAYTTCAQWTGQMTEAQRLAMVRPILPVLRRTVDTAASAGEELLPSFVQAIAGACARPELGPDYVVTAAAAFVFTLPETGKPFQP